MSQTYPSSVPRLPILRLAFSIDAHYTSSAILYDGKGTELECFQDTETRNGFTYEIEEVRRCVTAGLLESDTVPHSSTLACAQVFDLIAEQTRTQGEAPLP